MCSVQKVTAQPRDSLVEDSANKQGGTMFPAALIAIVTGVHFVCSPQTTKSSPSHPVTSGQGQASWFQSCSHMTVVSILPSNSLQERKRKQICFKDKVKL